MRIDLCCIEEEEVLDGLRRLAVQSGCGNMNIIWDFE